MRGLEVVLRVKAREDELSDNKTRRLKCPENVVEDMYRKKEGVMSGPCLGAVAVAGQVEKWMKRQVEENGDGISRRTAGLAPGLYPIANSRCSLLTLCISFTYQHLQKLRGLAGHLVHVFNY